MLLERVPPLGLSCPFLSRPVLSFLVSSGPVLSCPFLAFPTLRGRLKTSSPVSVRGEAFRVL